MAALHILQLKLKNMISELEKKRKKLGTKSDFLIKADYQLSSLSFLYILD